MKTTEIPHLEQDKHPSSKFVWSSESTMYFFVVPFLGMTPEYEKRGKQRSRGAPQTGVNK